jgi:hypothetical protein
MWTGGHVSVCLVDVTWINLDSLALTLHFMSQFCIARRRDCNLLEAVAELLSMARTAGLRKLMMHLLLKLGGRRWIVNTVLFRGHCLGVRLHEWGRVQCTRFQSYRENVCFAGKILEWWISLGGGGRKSQFMQYAILYRMLVGF